MAIESRWNESYPFKDAPYWNDLEASICDLKKDYQDFTLVDPAEIPTPYYINDLK